MARTLKEDSEIYRAVAVLRYTQGKFHHNPDQIAYTTSYFGPYLTPGMSKAAVSREDSWYTPVHVQIQKKMNEWETVEEWYEDQYALELEMQDGVDRRHLVR